MFRAAMIMLKGSGPAALDSYEEGLRQLSALYPQAWGIIAVADDVMRSEKWERIMDEQLANPTEGFDHERPWDHVIRISSFGLATGAHAHFWKLHVEAPMSRNSGGSPVNVIRQIEGWPSGSTDGPHQPQYLAPRAKSSAKGGKSKGKGKVKGACYTCGGQGHIASNCPSGGQPKGKGKSGGNSSSSAPSGTRFGRAGRKRKASAAPSS